MRYSIYCGHFSAGSHDVSYVYEAGVETGLEIARAAIVLKAYEPIAFPIGFTNEEKNAWAAGRRSMLAQAEHAINSAAASRASTDTVDQPAGLQRGPAATPSREAGPAPSQ